jgi:hypothetical protein
MFVDVSLKYFDVLFVFATLNVIFLLSFFVFICSCSRPLPDARIVEFSVC